MAWVSLHCNLHKIGKAVNLCARILKKGLEKLITIGDAPIKFKGYLEIFVVMRHFTMYETFLLGEGGD